MWEAVVFGALHAESAQAIMMSPGLLGDDCGGEGGVNGGEQSVHREAENAAMCSVRKLSDVPKAPGALKAIAGEDGAKPPHH